MNDLEGSREDYLRFERVLNALNAAEPDLGLQERVLQRLATAPDRATRVHRISQWLEARFILPAAASVVAVCVVGLVLQQGSLSHLVRGDHGSSSSQIAKNASVEVTQRPRRLPFADARELHAALLSKQMPHAARHKVNCATDVCAPGATHPSKAGQPTSKSRGAQQEASFPAPEMPLTEQERLLLLIAHRNDPVQVTMLDPVERDVQQARERVASARFFAPAKLPPELQEEINAGLRSQYVNTPPPHELLPHTTDQTADRSNR